MNLRKSNDNLIEKYSLPIGTNLFEITVYMWVVTFPASNTCILLGNINSYAKDNNKNYLICLYSMIKLLLICVKSDINNSHMLLIKNRYIVCKLICTNR